MIWVFVIVALSEDVFGALMLKYMMEDSRNSYLENRWGIPRTCISELGVRVLVASDISPGMPLIALVKKRS